jgi:DNA-binding LacI/PurR family transcriptional regulator
VQASVPMLAREAATGYDRAVTDGRGGREALGEDSLPRAPRRHAGAVAHWRASAPRRVTLREVAQAAGVSPSTVSRVLAGVTTTVPITDDTRQRVLAHAQELGYRPNPLARGLRGSPTALVGLIVRAIAYPLHAMFIESIVEAARAEGSHVVIGSSSGIPSESLQLEMILETRMCDGVLMVGGLDEPSGLIDDLHAAHIPLVGIGLATVDPRVTVVRSDNAAGARMVFEHLFALGHRRFAVLVVGAHPELDDRRDAFLAASGEAGLSPDAVEVIDIVNTPEDAAAALRRLVASGSLPTAVFSTTDMAALGVLRQAADLGLRVPRDLSVVGFDDLAFSATTVPPLTTVRQDVDGLSVRAVRLIVDAIRGSGEIGPIAEPVPVSLRVRSSTGPPSAASSLATRPSWT